MPTTEPDKSEVPSAPTVLLTGPSVYVGGRLLPLLAQRSIVLRSLARKPDRLRPLVRSSTEVVRGDVLAYLLGAKDLPKGESRIFEIGSPDVVIYGDLIRKYARQQGLRRWLIFVPVLTTCLSGLWLALVTPATYEVGRHVIEGLKNPTVVRGAKALEVFPIRPMGVKGAMRLAREPPLPKT